MSYSSKHALRLRAYKINKMNESWLVSDLLHVAIPICYKQLARKKMQKKHGTRSSEILADFRHDIGHWGMNRIYYLLNQIILLEHKCCLGSRVNIHQSIGISWWNIYTLFQTQSVFQISKPNLYITRDTSQRTENLLTISDAARY